MRQKKQNSLIFFVTAVASLGGLLFGYDTAVISGAVGSLENQFIFHLQDPGIGRDL